MAPDRTLTRREQRLADSLQMFVEPFALDVYVMTPKQRAEVPLSVMENIFSAMDSDNDVLRRRASLAAQCLILCGIKATWAAFLHGAQLGQAE